MNSEFTYFDTHTHKKYKEVDIQFIRNAYHHLNTDSLLKLPYTFSLGLHPWDVNENYKQNISFYTDKLALPNCIAIGECGLDYFIKTDRELQKDAFLLQFGIAQELVKPIIIHCVKAYHELIPLIKNTNVPTILHQYNGSKEMLRDLENPNIYFSFGRQLFSKTFDLEQFLMIPKQRILLETDSSNLHIEEVYLRAASFLDLDFRSMVALVKENAENIFYF